MILLKYVELIERKREENREKREKCMYEGFNYLFCSPGIIRTIILRKDLGGRSIWESRCCEWGLMMWAGFSRISAFRKVGEFL